MKRYLLKQVFSAEEHCVNNVVVFKMVDKPRLPQKTWKYRCQSIGSMTKTTTNLLQEQSFFFGIYNRWRQNSQEFLSRQAIASVAKLEIKQLMNQKLEFKYCIADGFQKKSAPVEISEIWESFIT